jgi:hypothetical protein
VEFDAVAGRIAQERLPAGADRRRVGDVDSTGPEFCDGVVEVGNLERKMLTDCCRRSALDQVDLLTPGVEPRAAETEVRAVRSSYQAKSLDVKALCLVGIADVDRDMMNGERSHPFILPGSAGSSIAVRFPL